MPVSQFERTFRAKLTAADNGSGEWRYGWREAWVNEAGLDVDEPTALMGQVDGDYAVEINGAEVPVGTYVWMRYRCAAGRASVYEFVNPLGGGTPAPTGYGDLAGLLSTDCVKATVSAPAQTVTLEPTATPGEWLSEGDVTYPGGAGPLRLWYAAGTLHLSLDDMELLNTADGCWSGGPLTGHEGGATGPVQVACCTGGVLTPNPLSVQVDPSDAWPPAGASGSFSISYDEAFGWWQGAGTDIDLRTNAADPPAVVSSFTLRVRCTDPGGGAEWQLSTSCDGVSFGPWTTVTAALCGDVSYSSSYVYGIELNPSGSGCPAGGGGPMLSFAGTLTARRAVPRASAPCSGETFTVCLECVACPTTVRCCPEGTAMQDDLVADVSSVECGACVNMTDQPLTRTTDPAVRPDWLPAGDPVWSTGWVARTCKGTTHNIILCLYCSGDPPKWWVTMNCDNWLNDHSVFIKEATGVTCDPPFVQGSATGFSGAVCCNATDNFTFTITAPA